MLRPPDQIVNYSSTPAGVPASIHHQQRGWHPYRDALLSLERFPVVAAPQQPPANGSDPSRINSILILRDQSKN